jgi:hypothetical protein
VAGNYVSFILAQLAGKFDGRPASMRIIAAGSELQPGSEALYVMPGSRFKTVASLGKDHARVGELQRVPDSMFQYGLTQGAKSAYQIATMV